MTYAIGNPGLGQAQTCGEIKSVKYHEITPNLDSNSQDTLCSYKDVQLSFINALMYILYSINKVVKFLK
jgi:hypothetical protein